jgi:hypothetical protein
MREVTLIGETAEKAWHRVSIYFASVREALGGCQGPVIHACINGHAIAAACTNRASLTLLALQGKTCRCPSAYGYLEPGSAIRHSAAAAVKVFDLESISRRNICKKCNVAAIAFIPNRGISLVPEKPARCPLLLEYSDPGWVLLWEDEVLGATLKANWDKLWSGFGGQMQERIV